MSLFSGPDEHAANPPETWEVRKSYAKSWTLGPRGGGVFGTFTTKRDAEAARHEGFYATLYAREGRWYAGETVPGWKPYAEVSKS